MYRQARIKYWRRKNPVEGRSIKARAGYCLSDHFHRSGLEIKTCDELRLRKIAKDIIDYRCEVSIKLVLDSVPLGTYICDFVTEDVDGGTTFVEAKGIAFPLWKQKWRILQGMHRDNPLMRFQVVTC